MLKMPSFERNPFEELKPTVAQLRSDYQILMSGDTIREKAVGSTYFNDPKITGGFAERAQKRAFQAAQMIVDQVGRLSADELHRAVEPEKLKDVLLRGGAGLETFLLLGEYQNGDIEELSEKRRKRVGEIEVSIGELKDKGARSALAFPLAKLKEASDALGREEKKFMDQKGIKTKVQIGSYLTKRKDFEERLARLTGDIDIQIKTAA